MKTTIGNNIITAEINTVIIGIEFIFGDTIFVDYFSDAWLS